MNIQVLNINFAFCSLEMAQSVYSNPSPTGNHSEGSLVLTRSQLSTVLKKRDNGKSKNPRSQVASAIFQNPPLAGLTRTRRCARTIPKETAWAVAFRSRQQKLASMLASLSSGLPFNNQPKRRDRQCWETTCCWERDQKLVAMHLQKLVW